MEFNAWLLSFEPQVLKPLVNLHGGKTRISISFFQFN
uniref:Uncharacterized protein n=1 Tax=Rhizophora mucronata TaxID=61149 RepID=A0A2P2Q0L0_RHIMU